MAGLGIAVRALATRALRVAIMTDAIGWHTRALQRALRERGAEGRCVDLARCSIDTRQSWHGLVPVSYTHLTLPTNREV